MGEGWDGKLWGGIWDWGKSWGGIHKAKYGVIVGVLQIWAKRWGNKKYGA